VLDGRGQHDHAPVVVGIEQAREGAAGHADLDVRGVARLVKEVRVDVERHAHARVPEDAADLHDVELQVDDQVAGEGVPKVVKA
jgi:hypothetical protein